MAARPRRPRARIFGAAFLARPAPRGRHIGLPVARQHAGRRRGRAGGLGRTIFVGSSCWAVKLYGQHAAAFRRAFHRCCRGRRWPGGALGCQRTRPCMTGRISTVPTRFAPSAARRLRRHNTAQNSQWYVHCSRRRLESSKLLQILTVEASEPRARRQWRGSMDGPLRPGTRATSLGARFAKRCRQTPQHVRPKRQKLPRRYSRSHTRETARPRSNARPRAG